jgi:NADPH2:quinone reductase
MMKAIVLDAFGGVEHFHQQDWPMPDVKEGQVRIRIQAVSLNPVDYKMRKGLLAIPLPDVLGRDVAGTVDAAGLGVTEFQPGDEVFAVLIGPRSNGAYAQYVSVPALFVSPKPKGISAAQAACLGVAGMTAYDAVINKAAVKEAEAVLVAGASGGVGSFAVQLIRYCEAGTVIATAGSDRSADYLVNTLGVPRENILLYPNQSFEQLANRLREVNGGKGVDVAFDFVGGTMKHLCFQAAGFDGRVVSTVEEPAGFDLDIWRADVSPLFAKSGTFHFVALSARARNGGPRDQEVYREMMSELSTLVETGHIQIPQITELGELSEDTVREAHRLLEGGHVKGKLVLTVA